ncbi:hypothetical protein JXA32_13420 [Candidatus Sumerlaeota bacterium]|nr:hypothetical protein [Candidatus Sumerlaeota bacterium]
MSLSLLQFNPIQRRILRRTRFLYWCIFIYGLLAGLGHTLNDDLFGPYIDIISDVSNDFYELVLFFLLIFAPLIYNRLCYKAFFLQDEQLRILPNAKQIWLDSIYAPFITLFLFFQVPYRCAMAMDQVYIDFYNVRLLSVIIVRLVQSIFYESCNVVLLIIFLKILIYRAHTIRWVIGVKGRGLLRGMLPIWLLAGLMNYVCDEFHQTILGWYANQLNERYGVDLLSLIHLPSLFSAAILLLVLANIIARKQIQRDRRFLDKIRFEEIDQPDIV